ncbi:MAG: hypothetical protein HYY32_04320 [Chloroflexi bacterium]|nr:hypothetical protein [Chloroflexota bacterium]
MTPVRFLKPVVDKKRALKLAPRLTSLKGITLGTLWDNKPHADDFLRLVSEKLAERHGVERVIARKKTYIGSLAPVPILDELASTCDAVIVGVGD